MRSSIPAGGHFGSWLVSPWEFGFRVYSALYGPSAGLPDSLGPIYLPGTLFTPPVVAGGSLLSPPVQPLVVLCLYRTHCLWGCSPSVISLYTLTINFCRFAKFGYQITESNDLISLCLWVR